MSSETNPTPANWYRKACATRCGQHVERALTPNSSNSVSLNGALWDNGQILSYCFLDSCRGSLAQQTKVHQVIKEWEKYANIKFDHVDSQNAIIRITFDGGQGSWSLLGKFGRNAACGAPTMNLGWIGDNNVLSDAETGVILHEFGHALGLVHEHQSPAREGKLTFMEKSTIELFKSPSFTAVDIRREILNVYNSKNVTNGPELDFKSVMMYFMPAEMNEQGIDVEPNNKLSELDKAYINLFYPFDISATEEWTVATALQIVGFDEKTKSCLQKIYDSRAKDPNYWKAMRWEFRVWCALCRAANLKAPTSGQKRKSPPVDSSPTPRKKVKSMTT